MKKYNVFTDGKKNYNYLDSGISEFLYLVIMALIIAILRMAISFGMPSGHIVSEVASALVELGFVAAVLITSRISKTSVIHGTKLNKSPKGYQIGFTVLITFIAYFGFSSLTNSFGEFLDIIGYTSSSSGIDVSTWWRYLIYVVTMAALPAFCEELLFRGVIYNGLRTWSKTGAVFISALLFMLMHGSPDQTVHQFLLGIVLALVFNATGSIWCSMILHFLNNFTALTISFVFSHLSVAEESAAEETITQTAQIKSFIFGLAGAIAATALAGFIIWIIYKYLKKRRTAEEGVVEPQTSVTDNGQVVIDVPAKEVTDDQPEQQTEVQENQVSNKGKKFAIVFFVLSGIWVVFEWIQALIEGILR